MTKNFLIVILGPTAVGKTALAIDIAKHFGTEIISADSRQFFKEMNIGTAKPTPQQLKEVKHHFINSLSVTDEYNVGDFEKDALKVLNKIFSSPNGGGREGAFAIMAGGSGLYINAVCNGFDEVPPADKEIRDNIIEMYNREGIEYLRTTLKKLDKEHYSKVDLSNPHRMIRAIEVCMVTGRPYSELRKGKKQKRNFSVIKIGLELSREELYERINKRVDDMMKEGLLEEVKLLLKYKNLNSLNTVGYKELFEHLAGNTSLDRAIELIKQNTRNYAKRQLTWFNKDKEIKWFTPLNSNSTGFNPKEKGKTIEYIKDAI